MIGTIIAVIYFAIGLSLWGMSTRSQSDFMTLQKKIEQFFAVVFLWPLMLWGLCKWEK